nr:plexin-A2-like [Crassostrea gigas]
MPCAPFEMNVVNYLTVLQVVVLIVFNYALYASATPITKELPNPHPEYELTTMSKYGSLTIILGGTNYLYRVLMKNLEKEVETNIGPRLDNPYCYNLENDQCKKKLYNSYIKVLLINNNKRLQQDEIIICTSLFQGSCGKRNVTTLELLPGYSDTSGHREPVVANNKSATTVAFLAPGPSIDGTTPSTVMYVGASWANTGLRGIRGLVPAFSSRRTENFSFTSVAIVTKSYTMVDDIARDSFPIRYIYGFTSGNFSYMGTIQKPSVSVENYVSKITRVCLFDRYFNSYAEAELNCEFNGKTYNLLQTAKVSKPGRHLAAALGISVNDDVLFGMFGYGYPNDPINSNKESAMCIYPIWKIKQVFTLNTKTCFKGTGRTGPEHITSPRKCQSTPFDIDNEYCGKYDFNTPINGPELIKASRTININTTASSLIVTTTHSGYTVAFIGTRTGHIKKVSIESSAIATEYDDITVDPGFPILKDMIFDEDNRYLYVLSPNKLVKIVVQNCNQYTTCEECKGANDPYCGWCSMENKCSLAEECSDYGSALNWMAYNGKTCTKITQVYPDKIQKDRRTTTISLNISNLPTFIGSYKCAFHGNGKTIKTEANRTTPFLVKCDTPVHNELPSFPIGADYITMRLSVVIMEFDFVSANFTFFDCKVHTSCFSCTSSLFNCTWCIKTHLCTHYPVMDCSNYDDFIAGKNSKGITVPHVSGPYTCPSIYPSNHLVPSGTEKIISLSIKNLKPYQKPIRCAFEFNSQTDNKGELASIVDMGMTMIIKCNQTRFSYPGDSENYTVPLKIYWDDQDPKQLDNPFNVQVIMYKCDKMASSCGECLTQNEAYSCGWCNTSNQCSLESSCTTRNGWFPNTKICPNPTITRIYPLFGPKKGGTLLTIEGIDLGKFYENVVSNVDIDVAGCQCAPIRKEFVISKRIVCKTGRYYGQEEKKSEHVYVTVALNRTAKSKEMFTYVDPEITDIIPKQGPKSGGTKVTILGNYLNAGTRRRTFFGNETFECNLIEEITFSSNVTCVTAPSNRSFTTESLYMDFDNQQIKSHFTYRYVEDPIVTYVNRLASFVSGGLSVLVSGEGFNSINTSLPKMVFYRTDLNQTVTAYYGECLVLNDVTMECITPQVEPSMVTNRLDASDKGIVAFGFVIDNVKNIRNFSETYGEFFQIFEDPEINVFPNDKTKVYQQTSNEYLTISGTNLDQIRLKVDDVVIKIGKSECYVTSTGRQLTCLPPKEQPIPVKSRLYPEVEVTIGKNLKFFLGFLKYKETYIVPPVESIAHLSFRLYMYIACMYL